MAEWVWKSIVVFLLSAVPLSESKGAILVARLWDMPLWLSGILCMVGSYIPVLILLFGKKIGQGRLFKKLSSIPDSVQRYIEKYGCWALLVTIAIPFTGMGCWIGAFIARSSNMNKKRAALCIFIGDLIAVVLMTGCIHGIVTAIEKLIGIL